MRDRKKRNIVIGSLCCLLVFMGIGYAILTQTLNISGIANMRGNWNVKITNMKLVEKNKTGKAKEISHSFTDTTATFEADLYMPGDSIEYEVTVTNGGNIDAVLKSITPTTTNKNVNIKFSHSTIDNTVLTAGKTISFTMKVEFLEDATTIPNIDTLKYSLELVYVQYNGGDYTPAVEATEESCFAIDEDGNILSYNSDECGTNVVVPAKVNNIPVKNVNRYVLTNTNASKIDNHKYVIDNQEEYDSLSTQATSFYRNLYTKDMNDSIEELANESGITKEEATTKLLEQIKEEMPDSNINTIDDYVNLLVEDAASSWTDGNTIHVKGASDAPTTTNKMSCTYDEEENTSWSVGGLCTPVVYFDSDGNYEGELSSDCGSHGEKTSQFSGKGFRLLVNSASYEPAKKYIQKEGSEFLNAIFLDEDGDGAATVKNPNYGNIISCESPTERVRLEFKDGRLKIFNPTFNITSIDLSQAIYMEEIEPYSFYENESTESAITLKLAPNLKTIGEQAFYGTNISGELLIPKNVENIYTEAFRNNSINTLKFESGSKLKSIEPGAFYNNKISNLTIPTGIEIIKDSAFEENQISAVSLPSTLKKIYQYAFSKNQLTSISIPKSVTTIGNFAFQENKITALTFETGTTIQYLNGFNNNLLTSVTIPKSVTEISHTAFKNNKITKINYENGINLKYLSGFEGNNLTSIAIPSTVTTIGYNAFTNNKLTNDGVSKLPSTLKRMLTDSFKGNASLTQITLTSPTDLTGWSNGSTVNGITVTYER